MGYETGVTNSDPVLNGVQGVAGSNPAVPTQSSRYALVGYREKHRSPRGTGAPLPPGPLVSARRPCDGWQRRGSRRAATTGCDRTVGSGQVVASRAASTTG